MFKTAFSTVACPEWTLARVGQAAAEYGFDGVELRTFGTGSRELACDPALTAAEKVRRIMAGAGVEIASLGTGVALDEPVRPAVLGRVIGDFEKSVRRAKSAIELAAQIECPLVRVFGFEAFGSEKRAAAAPRIRERLAAVADGAKNTGVRIVMENGGSFPRAADLLGLIDGIGGGLVGASYSAAVASDAGEDPLEGLRLLGDRAWTVKLKDRGADGKLCPIGEGVLGCADVVRGLGAQGYRGWVVVEWDRLWVPGLDSAEDVLPRAARRLYEWSGLERIGGRAAMA
jgi:sugar phosphate isomerase/epimerase